MKTVAILFIGLLFSGSAVAMPFGFDNDAFGTYFNTEYQPYPTYNYPTSWKPYSFSWYDQNFDWKNCKPTPPVPEPSTFLLLGAGLIGAGIFRHRRRMR